MKQLAFIILLLLSIIVPASARDITLQDSLEDTITYMNLSAELFAYMDYSTNINIDINKCSFEIVDEMTGVYFCPVNASTDLYVYTDKYQKPKTLLITGPLDQGVPKRTTYDWALVALTSVVSADLYLDDIYDIYDQSLSSGYYEDRYTRIVCGPDYENNAWVYFIANK